MIFRNSMRLLFSNFSNVWKLLLYYVVCVALSALVCWWFVQPIVVKLSNAGVFASISNLFSSLFSSNPPQFAEEFSNIAQTIGNVLSSSVELRFNYVFVAFWLLFVFPVTIDMALLPMGEVLYGYMTSQVRYTFTGRYIKNIGKSVLFAMSRYVVLLPVNAILLAVFCLVIKFLIQATLASIVFAMVLLTLLVVLWAVRQTIFSCWMPAISVLGCKVFAGLGQNFEAAFRKFFAIFSNAFVLALCAIVFNLIFTVFTATISLSVTIPLTVFVFVIFQMVSFFDSHGMRYYIYPNMFISPKTFEEQDKIQKIKNLL